MMLLQAGQMGLYRKDSIWTDALPPDMVSGATMWLDPLMAVRYFRATNWTEGRPAKDSRS